MRSCGFWSVGELEALAEVLICPICGLVSKLSGAHVGHIKSCKRKPPRDVLEQDVLEGATVEDIQRYYGAGNETVRRWLDSYDLVTKGLGRKGCKVDLLRIYPGYSPKRGKRLRCIGFNGRPACNALKWCQEMVIKIGWILCEAPDKRQKEALERQGIDLLQLTTELWVIEPEIWTK